VNNRAAPGIFFAMGVVRVSPAVVSLLWLAAAPAVWAQNPGQAQPAPVFRVEVIAATPLPGVDLTLDQIPAPIQTALDADIVGSGAIDIADFLNRRVTGVYVNELRGNPFQPDVSYRGYTASPLLGTPQGLSVYMDGVRMNQPFGDVVSWDLVPRLAISSIAVMPGSNPLFGLNTLGGALAMQTKTGRTSPGTTVQALYGSDVRRAVEFEHGGSNASGLNWYVAGNLFAEHGWRDDSPSDVRQVFGSLGWKDQRNEITFVTSYADNSLTGNGLQEQRFLQRDYASVYTKPDINDNRGAFFNVTGRRTARSNVTLSGNIYYRDIRTTGINGDINEDSLDQSLYQPTPADQRALSDAGYTGYPMSGANASNTPFPYWRCIAQALQRDEPAEKCNGLINSAETDQHNYGGAGQIVVTGSQAGLRHQLTAGAAYDGSRAGFQQSTQLGYLVPDRSITGVDAFGDGVTGGEVDGEPYDTRIDLDGHLDTWSVYGTDTLTFGHTWNLTVSGRYNRANVHNLDRIRSGMPGSLDARYTFGRLNPAAGVTFSPSSALNVYAGYSEGSRAPTSIELGCADPDLPCKLPNAMAGDPPLDQVVTRTVEAGFRGDTSPNAKTSWTVGFFTAENVNDILFVSSTQSGFGYFKNFGNTRRRGMELSLSTRTNRVSYGAGYTYLDATYESAETVGGSGNSSNDTAAAGRKGLEGAIEIEPGDRIPLVPAHTLKAFAEIQATSRLTVNFDLIAASSTFARGNENNRHQLDGTYYLGPGTSDAYGVVNLGVRYRLTKQLELTGQVNNLFDHHYSSAAQLGPTGFTDTGNFIARPLPPIGGEFPLVNATFYAPGSPTTAWIGLRFKI
jgi:outer membrane receptor protein involved in Fe transport